MFHSQLDNLADIILLIQIARFDIDIVATMLMAWRWHC